MLASSHRDFATCIRALRLFDDSGNIANSARVLDHGFEIGMTVMRKADITPDHVILSMDGHDFQASSESFIENKWKRHQVAKDPEELTDWVQHSCLKSLDFSMGITRGAILKAMLEQYSAFGDEKNLRVFLKPRGLEV